MKYKDLKSVFDDYTNFTVDTAFVRRVYGFVQGFINKNDEHTEFFGGSLLGVNRPVYKDIEDGRIWIEEICGIEESIDCQEAIHDLPEIDETWEVAGDMTNLSFLYVAYRIHTSGLKEQEREMGIIYTIMMANIKHLTSQMRRRFPYPANPAIAMAAYEALDYRSDLKRLGSWYALLENRGQQALERNFVRRKQLETFQGTYDIVRWANDLQGRIVDILNVLTGRFHDTKDSTARIGSASRMKEIEGITEIRSYRNIQREMIDDILRIVRDRNDFIRPTLIDFTMEAAPTGDPRLLRDTLEYIVDHYREDPIYENLLKEIVVYMFTQAKESKIDLGNVPQLVEKIAGMFRSGRTQRPEVVEIKRKVGLIVEDAIPRAKASAQVGTKIALFVYLVLRIIIIPKDKV